MGSTVNFYDFLSSTYHPRSVSLGQVGALLHLDIPPAGSTLSKLGMFLSFIP